MKYEADQLRGASCYFVWGSEEGEKERKTEMFNYIQTDMQGKIIYII